jgi:hypothetical protein
MVRYLLTPALLLATGLQAQTYFHIEQIQVQPAQPAPGEPVTLDLIGGLSSTGAYILSSNVEVLGTNITLNIEATDEGGLTVIVPYTHQMYVGPLAPGTYSITVNGVNVTDQAPTEQHSFVVSGLPPCQGLEVQSVRWQAFSDSAVVVQVTNSSSNLFAYPGFILLDEAGDTLAVEEVSLFGILGTSMHILDVRDVATMPTGPFQGALHLYTGFGAVLACTFTDTWELCPPDPCQALNPAINSNGPTPVVGDFAWSIVDAQGTNVATGVFTLTNDIQYASGQSCLQPGSYSITVTPLGAPTSGQPVFSVFDISGQTIPTQPVTWTSPVPMLFNLYAPCAEGTQVVVERPGNLVHHAWMGNSLRLWRADCRPIGPLEVIDATGRVIARDGNGMASEVTLAMPARVSGPLLVRHTGGVLRLYAAAY